MTGNIRTHKINNFPLYCSIIIIIIGIITMSATCDEKNDKCLFYEKKNAIIYDVFVENKNCTVCSRINTDEINTKKTLRSQNDKKNCEKLTILECYNIYLIADLIHDKCVLKLMTGELFLEKALNKAYEMIDYDNKTVLYHNPYTNYYIKDENTGVKFLTCYFPSDIYKNQGIVYACTYILCVTLTILTTLCYLFDFKKKNRVRY